MIVSFKHLKDILKMSLLFLFERFLSVEIQDSIYSP